MSGGSFNYAYSHVEWFADELGIRLSEKPDEFDPATMEKLREIEVLTRRTATLMKEVEWLFSQDTSPESFMARVLEIGGSNTGSPP